MSPIAATRPLIRIIITHMRTQNLMVITMNDAVNAHQHILRFSIVLTGPSGE